MHIKIDHLTRVEGHGNLEVRLTEDFLDARFSVVEAPRFFEALVVDRDAGEVSHVASRICGICAVSHKSAALKAIEAAMDVRISGQTGLLRRLAFNGEVLSSHVLHVYFLAAPDFFHLPSVFPLLETDPGLVRRAVRLKELGYALCDTVAGRHTHPVAMTVGGFSFVHKADALFALKGRLEAGLRDLQETVRLFKTVRIPEFFRETEYVSLKHPDRYAFYDGKLYSSEGRTVPVNAYKEHITERVEPGSTAKYARWHRPEYMVGALARFNNNHGQLFPSARQAAEELKLRPPCFNPFMIVPAQIVECIHCVADSLDLIRQLLDGGIDPDAAASARFAARAGRGVGAVEAPRGTLFHDYEFNSRGKCLSANMVIPTAQNLANLEADMRASLPVLKDQDKAAVSRFLEMLVRAYDPCISCSTH